ncbi:sporulation integral membrane protein YlbJ [Paenibacillus amylolyticus]|uniref:Sporulation integral membrane protein YlbJ n=1 Tax=Paenibacillus amylolyticus TaxID=1451 RepID=A0AAP5LKW0_PAEAM|nr:nucleoside recognition domain-containing protein [Paenibacillus amylolyticus]MDR6722376.1 sporulation integral membrane protein YlbJ [Paenibacillus amylolyticus]
MNMQTEVTRSGLLRTIFLSSGAMLLVVAVVLSPKEAFDASIQGLDIWWKIIFPAMLPFLMLSQMLTAFGFTDALGVLLGPLMQRLFRLPGQAGLAIAVGMCGGFPAGADAAARLVQDRQITAKQAGVLAAIAHFSNPMMIIIVLGTAFLHQPVAGYFLLGIHWISGWIAAMIGIRLLPLGRAAKIGTRSASDLSRNPSESAHAEVHPMLSSKATVPRHTLWLRMNLAAREARSRDGRGFGKLLGDTVSQAVQTLMMTGGFMIVFAVFIRLLSLYLTPGSSVALWPSLLEVHLGIYHLSQTSLAFVTMIALIAAVLGWGGLCSHLQVSAVLKSVGLATRSMINFVYIRLIHGLIAFAMSLVLWAPFSRYSTEVWTTFQTNTNISLPAVPPWFPMFSNSSSLALIGYAIPVAIFSLALLLVVMISLSGLIRLFNGRFSR